MIAKTTRSLLLCSVAAFAGAAMAPQSAAAAQRALLIGIEAYENVTNLEGPLEDAQRMQQFLIQNMGFRSEDTVVLSNGEATLEGLRAAFKRELIDGTRPGDRVVIYYSGHGGQVPDLDGDEEDGLDETLVSVDGHADREDGHNHYTDDEFGALLAQLADRDVTVIIDACHSGTIARGENAALRDGGPTPRTPITVGARPSAAAIMAHRQEESFVVPPILFGGGEDPTDMASEDDDGEDRQAPGQDQEQSQAGEQDQDQGAASNGTPQPGQDEGFQAGSHRIWSAAASFQYSWEEDGEGLFTKFLIEGAGADRRADANGNGVVSNAELIEYVRDKSETWCRDTQECADLSLGFTPTLEARGEDLAAAFVPIGQPVTDPTDVIVQGNIAGVAIEVLPGNHNRVGEQVAFRVSSKQPGWLILLDINAAGQITQLIPNDLMTVIGSSHEISGARPVTIPAEGSRLVFTASPPTGEGTLIAIVTQDNVPLNELVRASGDLSPQGDPQRYLAELARTLMEVWAGDDANRRLNWSMSTLRYTISQ